MRLRIAMRKSSETTAKRKEKKNVKYLFMRKYANSKVQLLISFFIHIGIGAWSATCRRRLSSTLRYGYAIFYFTLFSMHAFIQVCERAINARHTRSI